MLEEGGVLRRGTACSVQTGVFYPEAPATEKTRRGEAGTPPTLGARSREEQSKTLKTKAEQGLDTTGGPSTGAQPPLALVPARGVRWVLREHSSPSVGLTHRSLGVWAALSYQELEVFSKQIKTAPAAQEVAPRCHDNKLLV